MMTTLKEALLESDKRAKVVSDCVLLIDNEVASKSGLAALPVKGGYAVVKKVKPGIITEAVDHMLDEFVGKLDPFYEQFLKQEAELEPYFRSRDHAIANALLSVTDIRADRAKNRTLKKAYEKLRPMGVKHTAAAVPGIARLVAKHT